MCVCGPAGMNTHMHRHRHIRIHIYAHLHSHIMHTGTYTPVHAYTHTCTHTHVHTYIRAYIHTYIHTCTCTSLHSVISCLFSTVAWGAGRGAPPTTPWNIPTGCGNLASSIAGDSGVPGFAAFEWGLRITVELSSMNHGRRSSTSLRPALLLLLPMEGVLVMWLRTSLT